MKVFHVDYSRIRSLSHTDQAYLRHDPALKPYFQYEPGLAAFADIIAARRHYPTDRKLLTRTLLRQYGQLNHELPYSADILAADNTFTVTTAHQPLLFTGPLYHIYKIASIINLSRQLNAAYPDQKIIPVFVIGSEDHDWEELNHFHLFGKKYEWEKPTGGPAGRFDLEGLAAIIESVADKLLNEKFGQPLIQLLRDAHDRSTTYGQFHQSLLIRLFGKYGLVVLNMDDVDLKSAFIPVMQRELETQFSFQHVRPTQDELEKLGFKPQAYCREINLFYLAAGKRQRIEASETGYVLAETGERFSKEELPELLHAHPENFSPNVILRPLYQEFTLPNLAYIGGGGEVAYWLERKTQFEAAGIHFPVIIRRNSLLQIDKNTADLIAKADLTWESLLDDYDAIVKKYLISHSEADLTFAGEMKAIRGAYEQLTAKAEKLDPTLATAIQAEETKQLKHFEQLTSRLLRAAKHHEETNLKRIQRVKEKLFPNNGLQERHENFLHYYATLDDVWIEQLIAICNPLDERFTVVML
jgi:bacillithiol biosynthesis cysteine-adding enzyme BshC